MDAILARVTIHHLPPCRRTVLGTVLGFAMREDPENATSTSFPLSYLEPGTGISMRASLFKVRFGLVPFRSNARRVNCRDSGGDWVA